MDTISGKLHIKSPCESCELQSRFIFRHLDVEQLRCLSNEMDQVHYAPGEVIFNQVLHRKDLYV